MLKSLVGLDEFRRIAPERRWLLRSPIRFSKRFQVCHLREAERLRCSHCPLVRGALGAAAGYFEFIREGTQWLDHE